MNVPPGTPSTSLNDFIMLKQPAPVSGILNRMTAPAVVVRIVNPKNVPDHDHPV